MDAPLYLALKQQAQKHHVHFPNDSDKVGDDLVFVGGAIKPSWLIAAYTNGAFPWCGDAPVPWYNPNPRLILRPQDFHLSKNLAKLVRQRRYQIRFDQDYRQVMRACAHLPRRGQKGSWIGANMIDVYGHLAEHHIGHSVSVLRDGRLVGGLYGLNLGRAFFGESMFSREPNTSKLALWALCGFLKEQGFLFIDCQQVTKHLVSLGAVALPRRAYMQLLEHALSLPSLHRDWSDASPV